MSDSCKITNDELNEFTDDQTSILRGKLTYFHNDHVRDDSVQSTK